jgi:hypothetical protein
MASVTGSGSQLAFFGHGKSGANVNIDLTSNGAGTQPPPIQGKLNIEVFTSAPGTVAGGYQGSAFIPGATLVDNNVVSNVGQTNVTEELLSGSYSVVDETGHEAIAIIGSAAGGDKMSVVGSIGDTVTGSTIAGTQQLIDATGKNDLTVGGPETIFGGAGPTTVLAGAGDSIVGGSGDMLVKGGSHDTIVGGSGATTIQGGAQDSIVAGTGGIISVHGGKGHEEEDKKGHGGAGDNTVTGTEGITFVDHGHRASTVTGFSTQTDAIQSATSVNPSGTFLGTSHSSSAGTTLSFNDGSTMFLAGVADPNKIHFTR